MSAEPRSTEPAVADGAPVVYVAGLWRRLLAGLVDLLILSPVLALGLYLATRVAGLHLGNLRVENLTPELVLELFLKGGLPFYGVFCFALLLALLYGFLFVATTGRTPGLKLLGARVIDVYGERPPFWRSLLRCIGLLLGLFSLGLGLLWIGFDRHKRGLHDWLAGTYVVVRQVSPEQSSDEATSQEGGTLGTLEAQEG